LIYIHGLDCYNVPMDLDNFREICLKQCGLTLDQPILSAFSGGADSLSLLILLESAGFPVVAAHFNHHIRAEADQDEQGAGQLAGKLGIQFVSGSGNVPEFIHANNLSVEEGARQLRYQWLLEQAAKYNAQALAVGHTADDQVETVLMHLLRGTGLDGLSGMPYRQVLPVWGSTIPIVRPLLGFWRTETEEICRNAGLFPVMDSSNQSALYFRNRIRLELIPYLQGYNPQVKSHIFQTARILEEEQFILETIKLEAWNSCHPEHDDKWISLEWRMLFDQPESLRRSILRKALVEISPGIRDIDYDLTVRMSEFVLHPTRSGEVHLSGNLWLQRGLDRLFIWKDKPGFIGYYPQMENGSIHTLQLLGKLTFNSWQIEMKENRSASEYEKNQPGQLRAQVQLDLDRLEEPLEVRCAQPGERFQPLGMQGRSQKLSDYFINQKIPRQARKHWPLVVSGQRIVWVVGLGISESAAIHAETKRVAQISLQLPAHQPVG
jgi:tRNA(Ile)-lysidine synthase